MSESLAWKAVLSALPLVAILRGVSPEEAPDVAAALCDAGIRCVEVTLNSPRALQSIAAVRAAFEGRMLVGAGTVLTVQDVSDAASAGAELIVSPDANRDVIAAAKAHGLISLPGVFTPTEAFSALAAGADALKLFPADALGPESLRAWRAVLPDGTAVLPVGGVEPAAMPAWRAAGAAGFGVGSAIYRKGDDPDVVRLRAREFANAWRAIADSEAS